MVAATVVVAAVMVTEEILHCQVPSSTTVQQYDATRPSLQVNVSLSSDKEELTLLVF